MSVYPWSPSGFGTKLGDPALPSGTAANGVAITRRGAVLVATDFGGTTSVVGYQEETPSAATRSRSRPTPPRRPRPSEFPRTGVTLGGSSINLTWAETEGGSGVGTRSLQRQKKTPTTLSTCAGGTYADDGAPYVGISPEAASGLVLGQCYQWVLTMADRVGNNSITTSGQRGIADLGIFTSAGDVGTVGATGSSSHSAGTYTVVGSGADIWGTADGIQFLYRSMTGDGQLTARVTGVQNTHANAKAGVMFRDTLAANSAHAFMDIEATAVPNSSGG